MREGFGENGGHYALWLLALYFWTWIEYTVLMNTETITRILRDLKKAVDVCNNIDSSDKDIERCYPFAAGYARSAMQSAIEQLETLTHDS